MGDRGVAAVYRLYEVFTERFGVDNNFTGTLRISPPYSEQWLANEILTPSEEDREAPYFSGHSDTDELRDFLGVCDVAGLIELKVTEAEVYQAAEDDGTQTVATGKKHKWMTVTIPGFALLADEYTARKRTGKALETPK
jgi:hypothetical protein